MKGEETCLWLPLDYCAERCLPEALSPTRSAVSHRRCLPQALSPTRSAVSHRRCLPRGALSPTGAVSHAERCLPQALSPRGVVSHAGRCLPQALSPRGAVPRRWLPPQYCRGTLPLSGHPENIVALVCSASSRFMSRARRVGSVTCAFLLSLCLAPLTAHCGVKHGFRNGPSRPTDAIRYPAVWLTDLTGMTAQGSRYCWWTRQRAFGKSAPYEPASHWTTVGK
jgi:hypothetical protein